MGTFSKSLASCGGFIAGTHEVIDFLRIASRAFLFTAAAVPAAVGAALAALRIIRSDEGPQLFARVLENAALPARRPRATLGFEVRRATHLGITTPIVPVVVGDDWKAVLLWRALYDAGVYVNVALHPAVPPAGALLRTSVMATHDTRDARPRARRLRRRQAALRGRARPAAQLTPAAASVNAAVNAASTAACSRFRLCSAVAGRLHCSSRHKVNSSRNHPLFANAEGG